MSQQEDVFYRGAYVAGDAFKPHQVLAAECSPAVQQEQPSSRLAHLLKGNGHEGAQRQYLLRRRWETRQGLQRATVATVPSESRSSAYQAVPANRGVQVVKQKAVGAGQGEILWNQPLAFTRSQLPHEYALQIGVAVHQHGSIGVKCLRQLFQQQS